MNQICYNGEVQHEDKIRLSPVNRGLMYGDGCFDTLRAYKGKFLLLEQHYKMLSLALEYLGMKEPFGETQFREYILTTLEANGAEEKEVVVRTQCWREGGRGYKTDAASCSWMISLSELPALETEYSLATVTTNAIPNEALNRHLKLSNGLNYIMATREASTKGAADALMLTTEGYVSETTIANLFWIKGDTIYTPSAKCDLYPGLTRELLKVLIKGTDMTLEEGEFRVKDILNADFVFGSNSIREVFPIQSIDEVEYVAEHPVFVRIREAFNRFKSIQLK
jgi:branched-subunit amino acid aminotransferase/4-amino-4-deoxychorismate lyase